MKFDFIDLVSESIDYLLFGEKAEIALDSEAFQEYNVVKEAYLDLLKDMQEMATEPLVVVSDKDDLYEAAIELAGIVKKEAKEYVQEHHDVFVEGCKKKAKEHMKEYQSIQDLTSAMAKEKLAETALYFMTIFPILTEGDVASNSDSVVTDVQVGAATILASELTHIANKHQPYCCGQ